MGILDGMVPAEPRVVYSLGLFHSRAFAGDCSSGAKIGHCGHCLSGLDDGTSQYARAYVCFADTFFSGATSRLVSTKLRSNVTAVVGNIDGIE